MTSVIYPGSFDPFTNGHLDIVRRASAIFDKVIVAIGDNPAKKCFFNREDRRKMIEESVKTLKNVKVDVFDGLLVDYARSKKSQVVLRVIRNAADFDYETSMAQTNKALDKTLETVFMVSTKEMSFLSSRFIKEAIELGGDVSELIPEPVNRYIQKKTSGRQA